MPPLTEEEFRRVYRKLLRYWRYAGYVRWKSRACEWVEKNLPSYTTKGIDELMWRYVQSQGVPRPVVEKRPEYSEDPYHCDFRISIGGRPIYIETVLIDDDPDRAFIRVVSIHEKRS